MTLGDTRAVETLGFVGETETLDTLRALSDGTPSPVRSAARRGLVRRVGDSDSVALLQADIAEAPWPISNGRSTALLREHGGASGALIEALANPSFIARLQASKGLIKHFQLKPYKSTYGPLQRWCTLSLCKLPAAYLEGASALQQLFRPLQAGIPLDESALEYRPGSESQRLPGILQSLNTKGQPYDLVDMSKLDGQDAAWLRSQLFLRLSQDQDPRSAEALAELKPVGWDVILQEQLGVDKLNRSPGPLLAVLESLLERLLGVQRMQGVRVGLKKETAGR